MSREAAIYIIKTFSWEQKNVSLIPGSSVDLIMTLGEAFVNEPLLRPQLARLQTRGGGIQGTFNSPSQF